MNSVPEQNAYKEIIFFATGTPVPEVLTEEELISLLRLDADGGNAALTIRYYRDKGLLRGTRIGKHLRYTRTEVLRFLEEQTKWTNRRNSA